MRITEYDIKTDKISGCLTFACVSDLHGRIYEKVVEALKIINADMILLAGDILEVSNKYMLERNKKALDFLEEVSHMAPVYYCFGNHEIYYSHASKRVDRIPDEKIMQENIEKIKSMGINLINDVYECSGFAENLMVGGLVCGYDTDPLSNVPEANSGFIEEFDRHDAFKVLLCHYPHYYEKYLKNKNFDLILSGHAHGGQWRIFGHGVYSPHQGIFPKYTFGIYDGRFIINRGAVNNSRPIPRFFNPCEVLKINICGNS